MNYRHAYHAGNFADVVKHIALVAILLHLQKKDTPFAVIDSHAGRGIYDLSAKEARKTGEAAAGIEKLRALAADGALGRYLEAVGDAGTYPGSPVIAAKLLRPQDRLVAAEKHPEEYAALKQALRPWRKARAQAGDGYEALAAWLPPPERRGLVLIDPPFEARNEFAALAEALRGALKRFAHGIYLVWFPVKSESEVRPFLGEVLSLGVTRALRIDIAIAAPEGKMARAALLTINPPFGFDAEMRDILNSDRAPDGGPRKFGMVGRAGDAGVSYPELVLTVSCPDKRGIVAEVTRFLFERNCNILDSQQFGDRETGRFFLRVHFASEAGLGRHALEEGFGSIARSFAMEAEFFDAGAKTRTLIMVSRFGHALVDLLYRVRIGALKMEVPLIVSNHPDLADVAAANAIPFVHLPVIDKADAEARLTSLIDEHRIDLVVLARYMQILSAEFCLPRLGHIINIHHSFLPSFKGANPYTQAHARGVKLIGATAHYVTGDLDEGPIIEQAVERVTHALAPEDYVAVGRDIENSVLARAVKWHCEHRIMLNGRRTVIFP